jgi:hypothetical protein
MKYLSLIKKGQEAQVLYRRINTTRQNNDPHTIASGLTSALVISEEVEYDEGDKQMNKRAKRLPSFHWIGIRKRLDEQQGSE